MINTVRNELILFINGYLKGEYPDYIFKNKWTNEIPVFIYHHITSNEFEERLQYLKHNGYSTLTADQFEQALSDRSSAPEKAVVITFDDGLTDVYDVAYPLLKKYKLKAVVFLIPGWIGKPGVVTWDQVKEMHENDVIDFQSHSMNHPAIFTSARLIDFYNPRLSNSKSWNIPLTRRTKGGDDSVPPKWGTPIYQFSSRFSDIKRFYPDLNVQRHCVEHVEKNGNEKFFKRRNWRNELISVLNNYKKEYPENITFESQNEQIDAISKELRLSKKAIESQLSNKTVHHFAWPWNQVGVLTAKILIENGYTTSFMGLAKGNINVDEIEDFHFIRRVTGDFIKCLPGDGRQSFLSVMLHKIIRRFKSGTTY